MKLQKLRQKDPRPLMRTSSSPLSDSASSSATASPSVAAETEQQQQQQQQKRHESDSDEPLERKRRRRYAMRQAEAAEGEEEEGESSATEDDLEQEYAKFRQETRQAILLSEKEEKEKWLKLSEKLLLSTDSLSNNASAAKQGGENVHHERRESTWIVIRVRR